MWVCSIVKMFEFGDDIHCCLKYVLRGRMSSRLKTKVKVMSPHPVLLLLVRDLIQLQMTRPWPRKIMRGLVLV